MMAPLALMLMTGAALGNPKEIEDLLHIMNETKIEFTIPEEGEDGDGESTRFRTSTGAFLDLGHCRPARVVVFLVEARRPSVAGLRFRTASEARRKGLSGFRSAEIVLTAVAGTVGG